MYGKILLTSLITIAIAYYAYQKPKEHTFRGIDSEFEANWTYLRKHVSRSGPWTLTYNNFSIYSTMGRRSKMYDRFYIADNGKSGKKRITVFGLFSCINGFQVCDRAEEKFVPRIMAHLANKTKPMEKKDELLTFIQSQFSTFRWEVAHDSFENSETITERYRSGSTALIAIKYKNTLLFANCGDSRAAMNYNGVVNETERHLVENEKYRLERLKAPMTNVSGRLLIDGVLGVTRVFGFIDFQQHRYVTWYPTIHGFPLRHQDIDYVVMATRGVWDVMTSSEALEIIDDAIGKNDTLFGAQELADEAWRRKSIESISVIVMKLDLKRGGIRYLLEDSSTVVFRLN